MNFFKQLDEKMAVRCLDGQVLALQVSPTILDTSRVFKAGIKAIF